MNNYNGETELNFKTCLDDILVARNELIQSKLESAIHDPLLCDVYCLPSHNHQAFYLQVYSGLCYTLLYAKTYYNDYLGIDGTVMYPFHYVREADKHNAKKGDIFCGLKVISKENVTINQLISCLPKHNEIQFHERITLDGQITTVRSYQNNTSITLAYQDANDIKINELTFDQKAFMDDLYIYIENIIGNLLNR